MQGFLFILGVSCIVALVGYKIEFKNNSASKKIQNENEVELAVIFIETAANFVKKHKDILECNQITMWQYSEAGEGFIIEFYGFNPFLRSAIEQLLADTFGSWEISEDSKDSILHISHTGRYSYKGSWNSFNQTVWNEVKIKHPEWKIEKPYSYKSVLYI